MSDTVRKRKRPPTFQHYPANRAKKLKKAWVETAKIKSKWKAQKRREGIVSPRSGIQPQGPKNDGERHDNGDEDDKGSGGSSHSDSDSTTHASLDQDSDTVSNGEADNAGGDIEDVPPPRSPRSLPPRKRKRDNKPHLAPHDKNNARDMGKDDDKPSLRDLFQKAYSKSSLHTYKSDPLKRRRNDQTRGRGSSRGGRGGTAPTRGRGQPDMELRMNAMLEKIKRDYT